MKEELNVNEEIVLDYLINHTNNIKTISLNDLCNHLGIKSRRYLRKITNKLRNNGEPICYNNTGVFYSRDIQDINSLIAKLDSVIKTHEKTIKSLIMIRDKESKRRIANEEL